MKTQTRKQKKLEPIGDLAKYKSLKQFFSTPRRWRKTTEEQYHDTALSLSEAITYIYLDLPENEFDALSKKVEASITKFFKTHCGQSKTRTIDQFNDARTRTFEHIKWVIKDANI